MEIAFCLPGQRSDAGKAVGYQRSVIGCPPRGWRFAYFARSNTLSFRPERPLCLFRRGSCGDGRGAEGPAVFFAPHSDGRLRLQLEGSFDSGGQRQPVCAQDDTSVSRNPLGLPRSHTAVPKLRDMGEAWKSQRRPSFDPLSRTSLQSRILVLIQEEFMAT